MTMKPETYVCIKPDTQTPLGAKAGKIEPDGKYYVISFDDGKTVHYLRSCAPVEVEQNPECWRRQVQKKTALCECVNVVVAMAGHCMDCGGSVPEMPQDVARRVMIDEACRDYLNKPHGVSYPDKVAEQKRQESIEDRDPFSPEAREKCLDEMADDHRNMLRARDKREESMRQRNGWMPKNGYYCWVWSMALHQPTAITFNKNNAEHILYWSIGALKDDPVLAEKWGKEYAQYFQIPNQT